MGRKEPKTMKKNQGGCPRVDIGGQAVMEGVMMKAPEAIAIAVRRPDNTIVVRRDAYVSPAKKHPWMGKPFFRGMVSMVTMLKYGQFQKLWYYNTMNIKMMQE